MTTDHAGDTGADAAGRQQSSIYVEWDEPGAGGILVNGERLVSFSVDTDWSDTWNPEVNEKALRFLDSLPRLFQEVENAYATARRYEDEMRATASAARACKYGDPACPCQDGDECHYEGENPMTPPAARGDQP